MQNDDGRPGFLYGTQTLVRSRETARDDHRQPGSMERRQPAAGPRRGSLMSGPFIFIATNRLRDGRFDAEQQRVDGLSSFIEANEPRLIAFSEYASEDHSEVAVVQVHPDAASMEFHMGIVRDRAREATPRRWRPLPASRSSERLPKMFCGCSGSKPDQACRSASTHIIWAGSPAPCNAEARNR